MLKILAENTESTVDRSGVQFSTRGLRFQSSLSLCVLKGCMHFKIGVSMGKQAPQFMKQFILVCNQVPDILSDQN